MRCRRGRPGNCRSRGGTDRQSTRPDSREGVDDLLVPDRGIVDPDFSGCGRRAEGNLEHIAVRHRKFFDARRVRGCKESASTGTILQCSRVQNSRIRHLPQAALARGVIVIALERDVDLAEGKVALSSDDFLSHGSQPPRPVISAARDRPIRPPRVSRTPHARDEQCSLRLLHVVARLRRSSICIAAANMRPASALSFLMPR
jgi:hypothetical protein